MLPRARDKSSPPEKGNDIPKMWLGTLVELSRVQCLCPQPSLPPSTMFLTHPRRHATPLQALTSIPRKSGSQKCISRSVCAATRPSQHPR
ncbi:hypothetical protein E2C01_091472 [Portunus trituberculatus]|uniref:Uncharacterized protein n=1 Tax=Portunus trituberculatus TaxID=210409 RepID=A0A5B7JPG9_PORTR|nr:hypothetical protein [Portunus trituberculatus]